MLKLKGPIKLPIGLPDGRAVEFEIYFTKKDKKRYLILKHGVVNFKADIYLRIESACVFGHVMGSRRCDCGFQLKNSINIIANGNGLLIYSIDDDGRGLGIEGHFDTYFYRQVKLLETKDLYKKIKHSLDDRSYDIVADILIFFNVKKVKLITNNNKRIAALKKGGFKVSRVALEMKIDEYSAPAMMDKKDHLHYMFSFVSHLENFKYLLEEKSNNRKYSFLLVKDFYERLKIYSSDNLTVLMREAEYLAKKTERLVIYLNFFPGISFVKKLKKLGILSVLIIRDNLTNKQIALIKPEIGFVEMIKINK